MSHLPEYKTWNGMKARCYNPNHKDFKYYQEKGIQICQLWLYDFEEFYRDMGPKPTPKHSIDRIDSDNNYCPNNCRWATDKTQSNNRSGLKWITYKGETKTLQEWSEIIGINVNTLSSRVDDLDWDLEKCMTYKPNQGKHRLLTYKGETHHLSEWARIKNISVSALHQRLSKGMTLEEALETPLKRYN